MNPQDQFGDGVIWDLDSWRQPPQWLLDFFAEPIGNMYGIVQAIFYSFPDSVVTSWYRPQSVQDQLRRTNARAARVSQHSWLTAFDISNPDPTTYPVMAQIAAYWDPTVASWPRADGSGGYEDGPHFHMQQWLGHTPTWEAWYAALQDFQTTYGVLA